jgi:choline transport protein
LIYPDYVFEPYQGTLLCIAVISFAILFNSIFAEKLPIVEGFVFFVHLFGLLAVVITLLVMAPKNSASMVFTEFDNGGGWSTSGVSLMVGLLTPVYALTGVDSAVHMGKLCFP